VLDYLEAFSDQPVKIFSAVAAMVSISRTCHATPRGILRKLLKRDDIIALGESYWQSLIQNPDPLLPLYEETLRAGKTVEGHSAGASGKKLMAYVAAGVSSCHEPITAAEVLERLRLGLHVMIREGHIRRDLEAIAQIKDAGLQTRRLTLVTDGVDPEGLMKDGYMDFVVQKAIDRGFDPVTAVQMATLNVAEHFSLSGLIGGIAPGRYADMLIIPDERTIKPQYVISNGRIVAKEGEILEPPRPHTFTDKSKNSIHLPHLLTAADFRIAAPAGSSRVTARVIDLVTELVTAEMLADLPVTGSEIKADTDKDIIKVAAIDRTHRPGRKFVGLIRGFHMRSGAMAASGAWDTSDIIVVGVNDADMAAAVNRIRELQGGMVVYEGGKVIAEIPMPVLGVISELPMETLAEKTKELKEATTRLGVPFASPFLTLVTLTGAAIPYLRICEEGLVNLKDGKAVELFVA
jgi:adenine deaminase